jgi:hypothetical protein
MELHNWLSFIRFCGCDAVMIFSRPYKWILIVGILSLSFSLDAHYDKDSIPLARNTIFASFPGNGFGPSLNYEWRWRSGEAKMTAGIGVFYIPLSNEHGYASNSVYTIPIQVNRLYGNSAHWEYGLGLTYAHNFGGSSASSSFPQSIWLLVRPSGFRFQKDGGGLCFRIYPLIALKVVEFQRAWQDYVRAHPSAYDPKVLPLFGVDLF